MSDCVPVDRVPGVSRIVASRSAGLELIALNVVAASSNSLMFVWMTGEIALMNRFVSFRNRVSPLLKFDV